MSQRLNPKLTARSLVPMNNSSWENVDDSAPEAQQLSEKIDEEDKESVSSSSDDESNVAESTIATSSSSNQPVAKKINPKRHLLHCGTWIPKQFEVGRWVPRTGLWDCCGEIDHYSLYCHSLETREAYKRRIEKEDLLKKNEIDKTNRRKNELLTHIKNSQNNPESIDLILTPDETAIKEACSIDNSFNAPMLVAWLQKHYTEEPIMTQGLGFLLKHLATGEGCFLMHRHGALTATLKIQAYFKLVPTIQQLVLDVILRLLDCNYTRGVIVKEEGEESSVLKTVFSICHLYMNSRSHVDTALKCITQCSRYESCRIEILSHNIIPYIITFVKRYPHVPSILRSMLKLFNWITTTPGRMDYIYHLKGVNIALQCIKKHPINKEVLSPAIIYIGRNAATNPFAMEVVLRKQVVHIIINALKIVYDDEGVQLEGLKLLQILSKTSEGWRQIDAVKGGWQSITQGTPLGDALVHNLPGDLHNPGWCIGETPFQPLIERMKQSAARQAVNSLTLEPKAAWTSNSLQEFMGLSMRGKTLAINTEYQDVYFNLISTLDLLPRSGEEKEYWFIRLGEFEKENEVKIADMVATIQEMRKREAIAKNNASHGFATNKETGEAQDSVTKELYVNGMKVTTQTLMEADKTIDELQGNDL